MQTEAGQPLDLIIRRKELEREIGGGVFYWGIGNSLGNSMDQLLRHVSQPEVLFSIMRSRPKHQDVAPASVLLWTQYFDANGLVRELPLSALVLSRGDTLTGVKKRCYALVCHSDASLTPSPLATLDLSHFRNLGGSQGPIGFSQVTTNVEHTSKKQAGIRYAVSLRSFLIPPYFIRLTGSIVLLSKDREAIKATVASKPTSDEWRVFISALRNRQEYVIDPRKSFALSLV